MPRGAECPADGNNKSELLCVDHRGLGFVMTLGVKDALGVRCVKKNVWCVKNAWKRAWKRAWKSAWKSKNVVREKKNVRCVKNCVEKCVEKR